MKPTQSGPVPWDADPAFEELEKAGAKVVKRADAHTVRDGMFFVSGETPRTTEYELGLPAGITFHPGTGIWEKDTSIRDERYIVCRLKGRRQG